jgi:hypothetical protein
MSTVLSDHDILYSVLGGLQPGGTVFSWIAGLTACEALRLTQRFDENTSWDKRLFVYFSLVMSVTQAGYEPISLSLSFLCPPINQKNLSSWTLESTLIKSWLCKSHLGNVETFSLTAPKKNPGYLRRCFITTAFKAMGIITSFCISLMLFSKLYNQDAVSSW